MRIRSQLSPVSAALTLTLIAAAPVPQRAARSTAAVEFRVRVGSASLYTRTIGRGEPTIVLHGGPDFDHRYLLPDLDRLAERLRLIYYDQRGRGKSAVNVRPEAVTLASDVDDLDKVREYFRLDRATLLGIPGARCWPWNTHFAIRNGSLTWS